MYWVGEVWFETESVRGGDRKEIRGGKECFIDRHVTCCIARVPHGMSVRPVNQTTTARSRESRILIWACNKLPAEWKD